jgi:hypothetical protein
VAEPATYMTAAEFRMYLEGTDLVRGPTRTHLTTRPRSRITSLTWAFALRAGDGNRTRALSLGISGVLIGMCPGQAAGAQFVGRLGGSPGLARC